MTDSAAPSSRTLAPVPAARTHALIDGWDPYLDDHATLWLLHWRMVSRPDSENSWYWLFNHMPTPDFTIEVATEVLVQVAQKFRWPKATAESLRREAEGWLDTYYAGDAVLGRVQDTLTRPLAELDLVFSTPVREGVYMLGHEPRDSLPAEVFGFAVREFFEARGAWSAEFEQLLFEPGSPGRVFGLDDEGLTRQIRAVCGQIENFEFESNQTLRLIEDFDPIVPLTHMYAARKKGKRVES